MNEKTKVIFALMFSLLLFSLGFFCILHSISSMYSGGVAFNLFSFIIGILLFITAGGIIFIPSKKKPRIIIAIFTASLVISTSIFVYYNIQPRRWYDTPNIHLEIQSNDALNNTTTFIVTDTTTYGSEKLYWNQLQFRIVYALNGSNYDEFIYDCDSEIVKVGSSLSIMTNDSDNFNLELIYQDSIIGSFKFSI